MSGDALLVAGELVAAAIVGWQVGLREGARRARERRPLARRVDGLPFPVRDDLGGVA